MASAVTETFSVPGKVGEIALETDTDSSRPNFNPFGPSITVPAAKLTSVGVPFLTLTVPLALSPTTLVPVTDFVLLPSTLTFSILPGITFASRLAPVAFISIEMVSFSCKVLGETKMVTVALGKNHQAKVRPIIITENSKNPTISIFLPDDPPELTLNFGKANGFLNFGVTLWTLVSETGIFSSASSLFMPVIMTLFTFPISEEPANETARILSLTLTVSTLGE